MKERMLTRVVTYSDSFSDAAKALCDGLLAKEVDQRMGFKNGSCDEIRAHAFFRDINWRKLNAGTISLLQSFLRGMSRTRDDPWCVVASVVWLSEVIFDLSLFYPFRYSASSFCP